MVDIVNVVRHKYLDVVSIQVKKDYVEVVVPEITDAVEDLLFSVIGSTCRIHQEGVKEKMEVV